MSIFDWATKDELEQFKNYVTGTIDKVLVDITNKANKAETDSRLDSLELLLKQKTSDLEESAKNAAQETLRHKADAENASQSIQGTLSTLLSLKTEVIEEVSNLKKLQQSTAATATTLDTKIQEVTQLHANAVADQIKLKSIIVDIEAAQQSISERLEKTKNFPEEAQKFVKLLETAEANYSSINGLLSQSSKRKQEIEDLYKKIYGEDIKTEDGKASHTNGIKDELEDSYTAISLKTEALQEIIENKSKKIEEEHSVSIAQREKDIQEIISSAEASIDSVTVELKNLLPGGLAAGLSAAYEKKTNEEKGELSRFEKTFRWTILALVAASLIPFSIDIYLLCFQNKELTSIIKDTPHLIISILPLYFPILWFAYSYAKKINLSKRLIEEYTHKAVLGKTFSGLSHQIESLPKDNPVKNELWTKLLYNVLQVSSENPGKLITDYNKADHPLMEVLENSSKLSKSIEVLSKIPGFSSVAQALTEKNDKSLAAQEESVRSGLNANESLKSPPNVSQDSEEKQSQ